MTAQSASPACAAQSASHAPAADTAVPLHSAAPQAEEQDMYSILDTPAMLASLARTKHTGPSSPRSLAAHFESHPLTAECTPIDQGAAAGNEAFAALQALADETPLEERLTQYKQSGNDAFALAAGMQRKRALLLQQQKRSVPSGTATAAAPATEPTAAADEIAKLQASIVKRQTDARVYYSQAIDCFTATHPQCTRRATAAAQRAATAGVACVSSDEDQTVSLTERRLVAQCHSNRAQLHLLHGNYASCTADCRLALAYDAQCSKAYYRLASAALRLGKFELAAQAVKSGLQCKYLTQRSEIESFHYLRQQVEQKQEEQTQKKHQAQQLAMERAKQQQQLTAQQAVEQQAVHEAIALRGLTLSAPLFDFASLPQFASAPPAARLDPHDDSLHWPLLFLYPAAQQTDYIQSVHEQHLVSDHLAVMFPAGSYAEWDTRREYTLERLQLCVDLSPDTVRPECSSALRAEIAAVQQQGKGKYGVTVTDEGKLRVPISAQQTLAEVLGSDALQSRGYAVPVIPTFCIVLREQ